jgi:hypothetical protein
LLKAGRVLVLSFSGDEGEGGMSNDKTNSDRHADDDDDEGLVGVACPSLLSTSNDTKQLPLPILWSSLSCSTSTSTLSPSPPPSHHQLPPLPLPPLPATVATSRCQTSSTTTTTTTLSTRGSNSGSRGNDRVGGRGGSDGGRSEMSRAQVLRVAFGDKSLRPRRNTASSSSSTTPSNEEATARGRAAKIAKPKAKRRRAISKDDYVGIEKASKLLKCILCRRSGTILRFKDNDDCTLPLSSYHIILSLTFNYSIIGSLTNIL